eukprot:g7541.t1
MNLASLLLCGQVNGCVQSGGSIMAVASGLGMQHSPRSPAVAPSVQGGSRSTTPTMACQAMAARAAGTAAPVVAHNISNQKPRSSSAPVLLWGGTEAMGRVIRGSRKGKSLIFTAKTRLRKGAVKLRAVDYAERKGYIKGLVKDIVHDPGRECAGLLTAHAADAAPGSSSASARTVLWRATSLCATGAGL